MGVFGGSKRSPAPAVREPTAALTAPPDGDTRAVVYTGLTTAPLSVIVHGSGDIGRCFAALSAVAPVFRTTRMFQGSILGGCFPGQEGIVWTAVTAPSGSFIAVHYFTGSNGNFHITQIDMKLRELPDPWRFSVCASGRVPMSVARHFDEGTIVPVAALPGLEHLQADLPPEPEPDLARQLLAAGWEQLDDLLRAFVRVDDSVSQVVIFGRNDDGFVLSALLADAVHGAVPEPFSHMDPGPYHLRVAGRIAALESSLPEPISELSANDVNDRAVALAEYAVRASKAVAPPPLHSSHTLAQMPVFVPEPEPERSDAWSSVTKGANVSLTRQVPNLSSVSIVLRWELSATAGVDFDLDASAIATGPDLRVLSDEHFVFYNNPRSPDGCIQHLGAGAGAGAGATITVDLGALPASVTNIFFPVSIYEARSDGICFGGVDNASIRVLDRTSGAELVRFDLTTSAAATETALVFGELYRRQDEWKFRAIGQGYAEGLAGIARDYGVEV